MLDSRDESLTGFAQQSQVNNYYSDNSTNSSPPTKTEEDNIIEISREIPVTPKGNSPGQSGLVEIEFDSLRERIDSHLPQEKIASISCTPAIHTQNLASDKIFHSGNPIRGLESATREATQPFANLQNSTSTRQISPHNEKPVLIPSNLPRAEYPEFQISTDPSMDTPTSIRNQAAEVVSTTLLPLKVEPHIIRTTPSTDLAQVIIRQIIPSIHSDHKSITVLELSPVELGNLQIQISGSSEQLQLHLRGDNPATVQIIRAHSDILNQQLLDAGYQSVDLSFSEDTPTWHNMPGRAEPYEENFGQEEAALEQPVPPSPHISEQPVKGGLYLRI